MSAAVLAALELGDRLKDYGAYAGVASIFGLAVLSLLYFGQARELKRLREWAGREPERAAEREVVIAQQRQVSVPSPVPASVVPQPRPRQAAAAATAAGSATQVLKPGELPGAGEPAATPAAAPAPAANGGVTPPAAPAPGAAADEPVSGGTDARPAAPAPAAGTPAAPATPGSGPARPTPAGSPPPAATPPAPAAPPVPRPRPTVQIGGSATGPRTPAGAAAAGARRGGDGADGRSAGRLTAMVVGGIAGVALIAILLVTVVFGGGDGSETAAPRNTIAEETPTDDVGLPNPGDTSTTAAGSIARTEVRVAVLNGTTANGLAREAMSRLTGAGYQEGATDNAPDRTMQSTQVLYAEGYRRAAQDVARLIGGVAAANVLQLDRSTQVVAGEDAKVVVVLGADKT